MTHSKTDNADVHECNQKEKLDQFHDAIFGADGILTRFARFEGRMETKMGIITKQNWILLTLWLVTIGGVLVKEVITK
jgi:hypothetical protein